jgi:hypothetical protein
MFCIIFYLVFLLAGKSVLETPLQFIDFFERCGNSNPESCRSKQAHYANIVTHLHNFAIHFYGYIQGGRARHDFSLAWLKDS